MKAIRKLNILLAVLSCWSMIDLFLNKYKGADFCKVQTEPGSQFTWLRLCLTIVSSGQLWPGIWADHHWAQCHGPEPPEVLTQPVLSCPHCCTALARSKGTSNYDVEIHRNNDCPMFIFIVLSTLHFWTFNCTFDSTLSTFKLYPNHYLLCLWSAYQ